VSYRKVAVFKTSRAVSTDTFVHGARPYGAHLEKTLIDSAPFARVYPHAWQVTGEPFCRTITEGTLGLSTFARNDFAWGRLLFYPGRR